jgi:hypothetical protein
VKKEPIKVKGHRNRNKTITSQTQLNRLKSQGLNQTLAIKSLTNRFKGQRNTEFKLNAYKTFEALEMSLNRTTSSKKKHGPEKYTMGMNLTRITEFDKDLHASIINS